ncbi:hypothetical protein C8F01DRAFT_194723 [Mycena amicta]|nr:hypothetical protein C8F01DRAFT_194723 [Mycena amicta]
MVAQSFAFDGPFAFLRTYPLGEAPSPCMTVEGVGSIGLPLGERDARAIIAASNPAGAGIWEVPAEKIVFERRAWDEWVQCVAGVSAVTALASHAKSKPSFVLKKLTIQEKDSEVIYETSDGQQTFGTLTFVLPGQFDDGLLQLRYAGETKSFEFSHLSELSTSLIAAYGGVEHVILSVAAGYRVCLAYDIILPGASPLPDMSETAEKVRGIFRSWKHRGSPDYLACLLKHQYTNSTAFDLHSLEGCDARLLAHLRPLADELEFVLYLAHVQATVTTSATATRNNEDEWGIEEEWGESEIDEDYFEDDEDPYENLEVIQVVNLDGLPVDVRGLDPGCNDLLNGCITEDSPADSTTLERDANDPTYAERIKAYNRTILLIWPKDDYMDRRVKVGDIYDFALDIVEASVTSTPTEREEEMVLLLHEHCYSRRQEAKLPRVVPVLQKAAIQWNDPQTFFNTLAVCGVDRNVDLLGEEGLLSACRAFGWGSMKAFCENAIKNDRSKARRRHLLTWLAPIIEEHGEEGLRWCAGQSHAIILALGPVASLQIPWLVNAVRSDEGELLQRIFAQLEEQDLDQAFWVAFIHGLQSNIAIIHKPQLASALIANYTLKIVQKLSAFPTIEALNSEENWTAPILDVLRLCIEVQNQEAGVTAFQKMRDEARECDFTKSFFPPWRFYSALFPGITGLAKANPTAAWDRIFHAFFVDCMTAVVSGPHYSNYECPLDFDSCRRTAVAAAQNLGGLTALSSSLPAELLKRLRSESLQALGRLIVREFPRETLTESDHKARDDLLDVLAHTAVENFEISWDPRTPSVKYTDAMISLIRSCFDMNAERHCEEALFWFATTPKGANVEQHVSHILAPFMLVLRTELQTRRRSFEEEPYRQFAVSVVTSYAERVMLQTPVVPTDLRNVGFRKCEDCKQLRNFFKNPNMTEMYFAETQALRKHLEAMLGRVGNFEVKIATVWSDGLKTLKITKPDSITSSGLGTANGKRGRELLNALGSRQAQTNILGTDEDWLRERIDLWRTDLEPVPLGDGGRTMNTHKRSAESALTGMPLAKRTAI